MQINSNRSNVSVQYAQNWQDEQRKSNQNNNNNQTNNSNGTTSMSKPVSLNRPRANNADRSAAQNEQERQDRLTELTTRLNNQQREMSQLNHVYHQQLRAANMTQEANQRDRINPFQHKIGSKAAEISNLNNQISTVRFSGSIGGFVGNQGPLGRMFSFKA